MTELTHVHVDVSLRFALMSSLRSGIYFKHAMFEILIVINILQEDFLRFKG